MLGEGVEMSDYFKNIYKHHADAYHQMISAEDAEKQLLPAIEGIVSLAGKRVVDLGSGTGRFPLLLHGQPLASLTAIDLHEGMLREQMRQRRHLQGNWRLLQADICNLPLAAGCADVVMVGWAMGHFQSWFADHWQEKVSRAVEEMTRITAAGGMLLIFETMGTGTPTAAPPTTGLANYYQFLEQTLGFRRQVIATDFVFDTVEQAVANLEFFFPFLAERIVQNQWTRIPEWTGVWSRSVA